MNTLSRALSRLTAPPQFSPHPVPPGLLRLPRSCKIEAEYRAVVERIRIAWVARSLVLLTVLSLVPLWLCPQGNQAGSQWNLVTGSWELDFSGPTAHLTCFHRDSGVQLRGWLTFVGETGPQENAWQVSLPRDAVKERLTVRDHRGDIQGYLTFSAAGDRLRIGVIHRAAQNFPGELKFQGEVRLPGEPFACRTRPGQGRRVVQLASGNADSLLNDSLFDPLQDTLLSITAGTIRIVSGAGQPASPFGITLAVSPHLPGKSEIVLDLVRGYYRSNYAPYYRPLDRRRCPRAPTGWLSWNTYFDDAGENVNLAEAEFAARHLRPFGLEFWSLESWQENSPQLPVSRFHNLTLLPDLNKFPNGLKWLADRIRTLGFRPGIWTVPFGTGSTDFYRAHQEWFLHDGEGRPFQNWSGRYVLDPSQEAVRRHMEATHRIMSQDWGYEYFKIDGMSGRNSGYSAHFYERDDVRAAFKESCQDPLLLCIEALRRGIGPDRIWLACQGHYTGPELAFADAGRLGADIVEPLHPPEWKNYLNQARTTLNQLFVNNIAWYGDPDTLLVGEPAPLATARLAASVVALSGQSMFAGDKLAQLPSERLRLLQQCLPVCDIRPLDLYPIFEMLPVWDLKIRRDFGSWDVVSLFNWDETDREISLSLSEIGLEPGREHLVYEVWSGRIHRNIRESFGAVVPGHGNLLLVIHPAVTHPQVVASDRHLTQGGVDLLEVKWNEPERILSGSNRLAANHPTRLLVALPESVRLERAQGGPGVTVEALTAPGQLSVRVASQHSGPGSWELRFALPPAVTPSGPTQ